MNVTKNSTATNGWRRSLVSLRVASGSAPLSVLGWVCGSNGLSAARTNEASAATRKMYRLAADASAPSLDVPRAVPSQLTNPTSPMAGTFAQLTRMKMNGQLATIHPMVPQTRTGPHSRAGSFRWLNAIELVIDTVGT